MNSIVNIDKFKRIKNGFNIVIYKTDTPFGNGLTELLNEKILNIFRLITYIHIVSKPDDYIKISNSNNKVTLYEGFVSDFKNQTIDSEFVKMIYRR